MAKARRTAEDYAAGILGGDRVALSKAITLAESTRAEDLALAQEVLGRLAHAAGGSCRIGITGAPGAGKSTLIEALGLRLVESGRRVAVLTIDPSSPTTGGSILGDKTRMPRLSQEANAFIRPSPTSSVLGGVARATREAMFLCEAAGFDVVLVETVGVGQSETEVVDLVDTLVVLMLPGAGDELQGIKKGILELADIVAINKADGDRVAAAEAARADYAAALRYTRPRTRAWSPVALTVSAQSGAGLDALWDAIEAHRSALEASGDLSRLRRTQLRRWMWSAIETRLRRDFLDHPAVKAKIDAIETAVMDGTMTPIQAAQDLLSIYSRP